MTPQASALVALRCDLLLPGRGEPIPQGALVIKDAKIEWVGEYHACPAQFRSLTFQHIPVLMPGLWDCHVHFGGHGLAFPAMGDTQSFLPGATSLAGAVTVADLRRTLEAGVTSVRELSGVGFFPWGRITAWRRWSLLTCSHSMQATCGPASGTAIWSALTYTPP